MAKKPEVISVATTGRKLRNRIPRSRPRKKSSSIRGTAMAAARTAPSELHGTAFFKRKILVAIKTTAPTRRGIPARKMPATTSRQAARYLANCRSRKEWRPSEHVWSEGEEDGVEGGARASRFGGVWRLRSERADEDSWTYYDRPLPADLLALKEIIEKKYRRRRATVEELLSLREMVRDVQ